MKQIILITLLLIAASCVKRKQESRSIIEDSIKNIDLTKKENDTILIHKSDSSIKWDFDNTFDFELKNPSILTTDQEGTVWKERTTNKVRVISKEDDKEMLIYFDLSLAYKFSNVKFKRNEFGVRAIWTDRKILEIIEDLHKDSDRMNPDEIRVYISKDKTISARGNFGSRILDVLERSEN